MKCQARQMSDQMQCNACGLVWDMNDPDPPLCKTRDGVAVKPDCGGCNNAICDECGPQGSRPGHNPDPTFAKPAPPPNPPRSAAERARIEVNALLNTEFDVPAKKAQEDYVRVPRHYADNVGYAAAMLESSRSPIDRHNAPALRQLAKLLSQPSKYENAEEADTNEC